MKTTAESPEPMVLDEAEIAFNQMQKSLQAESMFYAVKKKIERDTAIFPEENVPATKDTEMSVGRYIPDLDDFSAKASSGEMVGLLKGISIVAKKLDKAST